MIGVTGSTRRCWAAPTGRCPACCRSTLVDASRVQSRGSPRLRRRGEWRYRAGLCGLTRRHASGQVTRMDHFGFRASLRFVGLLSRYRLIRADWATLSGNRQPRATESAGSRSMSIGWYSGRSARQNERISRIAELKHEETRDALCFGLTRALKHDEHLKHPGT